MTSINEHMTAYCIIRLSCACVLLLLLSACGYQFAGSGPNVISSGQALWVSFIGIEIDSPSAQTVIRRSLLEEGHALRGLPPAADSSTADLRVSGQLRSYSTRAISYSSVDLVRDYALTIEVELSVFRKGETTPFWKGTLQGRQNFPANTDLALQRSSEEAALVAASRSISQKLFSAVEQSY